MKALNEPGFGIAANTVEAIIKGPKWNPAKQNGRIVRAYHTQPINFLISENVAKNNDGTALSGSNKMKVEEARQFSRLKDPENGHITSFIIVYPGEGGFVEHINNGAVFDATTISIIKRIQPGDVITFEKIIAQIDGKEKKLPSLLLVISQ